MKKIVGLGANVLDTLIGCAKFPKEDTKMRADQIMLIGGGPVGNALVVTSKLGVKSEMLGAFSDDASGKRILSELERYGVGTKNTVTVPGTSSFVSFIILSGKEGTRTCVFDRGTVPDEPSLISFEAIDSASVLHLDGNYLRCAIAAAKYAKAAGVKVSLDAGGLYEGIEELLPLVDILIPSAEFASSCSIFSTHWSGIVTRSKAFFSLFSIFSPPQMQTGLPADSSAPGRWPPWC